MKCYVWSVLLYGSETWTVRKKEKDKIMALEMRIWRKMQKISWVEKISNEEVMTRINESRKLWNIIQKRKARWLGHIMRGTTITSVALEGTVEGEKRKGRKKVKMVDDIKKGRRYAEMKRHADNREGWRTQWCPGPATRQNTR